jgi:hypothetical protein
VSGTAAMAGLLSADDSRSDRSKPATHVPRTETRRRGEVGQASAATTTAKPLSRLTRRDVHVFRAFRFGRAKAEALIVFDTVRPRAERIRVTGTGTPETKSSDRPQYFVVRNDQCCAGVERAEKFDIVAGR